MSFETGSNEGNAEEGLWAECESKTPIGTPQGHLASCTLSELKISSLFEKSVMVRCIKTLITPSAFQAALEDGNGMIIAVAFVKRKSEFQHQLNPGHWYVLSNFEVRNERPEFLKGSVNDMKIIIKPKSTQIEQITDQCLPQIKFTTIEELFMLEDKTLVDLLCVCEKELDRKCTKLLVSLTDKSRKTINLTVWTKDGNQLVGIKDKIIMVKHVSVSSFREEKSVQAMWFSEIVVEPDFDEAKELRKWFQKELVQLDD